MAVKLKSPKRRSPAARALASPRYRQRVVKSRGRKRMEEIYARESRMVRDELQHDGGWE